MRRGLYVDRPESVLVHQAPLAEPGPDQVRIRVALAAIKHGTTFHQFSGRSPFGDSRFAEDLRLFVPKPADGAKAGFIGNMVTGTVVAVGSAVRRIAVGDRVFAYAPACDVVTLDEASVEPLLAPMSDHDALCLDPALFAFAAVRDAGVGVGDHVAVLGLGAIGLFVVQLLKLAGCLSIIAIDPMARRRELAVRFGATATIDPTAVDPGLRSRELCGAGADVAIEASGSYKALNQAMRCVRQCGRVVALGYYRGSAAELDLAREWLHNRLEMVCSLPDWGNPVRGHPQWDRARLWSTLIALFQRGALSSQDILDPIVELEEAPAAFRAIYADPGRSVKLAIRFAPPAPPSRGTIP